MTADQTHSGCYPPPPNKCRSTYANSGAFCARGCEAAASERASVASRVRVARLPKVAHLHSSAYPKRPPAPVLHFGPFGAGGGGAPCISALGFSCLRVGTCQLHVLPARALGPALVATEISRCDLKKQTRRSILGCPHMYLWFS